MFSTSDGFDPAFRIIGPVQMELTATHFGQLLGALDDASATHAHEARQEPRVPVNLQATVIPLAFCDSIPATVAVRDLSHAGIGFLCQEPLALDQQFVLLLPQEDDSPALLLCSVASWQPLSRDLFAIGARFLRVLRDAAQSLPIIPQDSPEPTTSMHSPLRRSA